MNDEVEDEDYDEVGAVEEIEDIIGDYEYKESYIYFIEKDMYSEEFDANVEISIQIDENSKCYIDFDDIITYVGTWKHAHDNYYDFQGFEESDKLVLRGINKYLPTYSDDELTFCEDDPQLGGIKFMHVFERSYELE